MTIPKLHLGPIFADPTPGIWMKRWPRGLPMPVAFC